MTKIIPIRITNHRTTSTCSWRKDQQRDFYHTGCSLTYQFDYPPLTQFQFCPYCGQPIQWNSVDGEGGPR